jgi:hypothetical protein
MVRLRHSQQNLGEVFFAREAESLMEAWMKEADEILGSFPFSERYVIAEQLLSLTRIQARGPLPSPRLPIPLRT